MKFSKYPSLELACDWYVFRISFAVIQLRKSNTCPFYAGMELDQAVVRSSFEPHFDDEKVQWWFGDPSKSLGMLPPEEYTLSRCD